MRNRQVLSLGELRKLLRRADQGDARARTTMIQILPGLAVETLLERWGCCPDSTDAMGGHVFSPTAPTAPSG